MPDLKWPEDGPTITDAEFKVIRGSYQEYEAHPDRPGWRFTGHFDADGDPLWHNLQVGQKHPRNPRATFIGLFDEKCRPMYVVKPRFLPEWLQDPITVCGMTWRTKGGFLAGLVFLWIPTAAGLAIGLVAAGIEGLRAAAHAVGLR